MAHTYAVIYVAQNKLEQLIRQDARSIRKAKERMICKHGPQPHRPRVQDGLVAKRAEAAMAMDDFNLLADADVAQYGEEGEDGGEGRRAVDDEEGHVVDFEAVVEVANALAIVVVMGDDDDFVASVDELAGELVDVRFDAAGLGEEEVADHGDVVCFAPHFVVCICGEN